MFRFTTISVYFYFYRDTLVRKFMVKSGENFSLNRRDFVCHTVLSENTISINKTQTTYA